MNEQESQKNNGMGPALLTLLGTLASSGVGAWIASRTQKKNYENQLDLAKYQTQVQEGMYNKYSSPEALMRQYKEAGLNPNLMYQGAGKGIANVPSYTAPTINKYADISSRVAGVIDDAAGKLSTYMNLKKQQIENETAGYQRDIASEAAEQATIKTFNDAVNAGLKAYNLYDEQNKRGISINSPFIGQLMPTGIDVNDQNLVAYQKAVRDNYFAELASKVIDNRSKSADAQDREAYNLYNYGLLPNQKVKYVSAAINPLAETLIRDALWEYQMKTKFDKPDKYFDYAERTINTMGGLVTRGLSVRALNKKFGKRK